VNDSIPEDEATTNLVSPQSTGANNQVDHPAHIHSIIFITSNEALKVCHFLIEFN